MTGPDYTRGPGFSWGFEIARRLCRAEFRERVRAAGGGDSTRIPACPQEPLADILARMTHHQAGLMVIPDDTQPEGVLIVRWEKR